MKRTVRFLSLFVAVCPFFACKKDHAQPMVQTARTGYFVVNVNDSILKQFQGPADVVRGVDSIMWDEHHYVITASRQQKFTDYDVTIRQTVVGPLQKGVFPVSLTLTDNLPAVSVNYSGYAHMVISRVAGDTVEGYCQGKFAVPSSGKDSIKIYTGFVLY